MRTKKAILNFLSSYLFYIVICILEIVKIKLFISYLGENIYSLNQLYVSLFSYIALIESGVGAAVLYKLYKPVAKKNEEEINALYSTLKKMFKKIAIGMIIIGFIVSFIIQFLIKDNPFSLLYLNITFMLFILKNTIDYFMFAPRLVVQADQKEYTINVRLYVFRVLEVVVEILLIFLGVNYLIILIPSIFLRIIQNLVINKKIFKQYPFLKVVKKENNEVKKEIKHVFVTKIINLVNDNVDIVILSSFLGAFYVAVYGFYNYIVKYCIDTIVHIFQALKGGLGNILNVEKEEKINDELLKIKTIFSYLAVLVITLLYFVLNYFVGIWAGDKYIASNIVLILFLMVIYYRVIIRSSSLFVNVLGLFKEINKVTLYSAILNLVLSLILVFKYKIAGVLLGTVISSYTLTIWYYDYVTYKKLFNKFSFKVLLIHLKNFIVIILNILIIGLVNRYIFIPTNMFSWLSYSFIIGIMTLILTSGFFVVVYHNFTSLISQVFKTFKVMIKNKKNE